MYDPHVMHVPVHHIAMQTESVDKRLFFSFYLRNGVMDVGRARMSSRPPPEQRRLSGKSSQL